MNKRDQVLHAVAEAAHRTVTELNDRQRLAEDLGLRSQGRIELAISLEEKLGTTVPDATVMRAKTVGDLVTALAG